MNNPVRLTPGYGDRAPDASVWVDVTGRNGSRRWRAADQQRSFAPTCGYVYHRFFDEHGASVDRAIRICN